MTRAELDQLISDAGVGGRTAKKLRSAFDKKSGTPSTPSTSTASKGHGAAAPDRTTVEAL